MTDQVAIWDFPEWIPADFVIVDRFPRRDGRVFAARPDSKTGLLWLHRSQRGPRGWHRIEDSWHPAMCAVAFAPDATWRAWWLYYRCRSLLIRATYPLAYRVLVLLARLARVEMPVCMTLRGTLNRLGRLVEEQRRREAEMRRVG